MFKRTLCKVVLSFLFLFTVNFAVGQNTVVYDGDYRIVGDYIEVLVDSSSSLTFKEALQADGYMPSPATVPNLSITDNTYWVRVSIVNLSNYNRLAVQLAHPVIDYLAMYRIQGNKTVVVKTGDMMPFENRYISHQSYILPFTMAKGDTATFYISARSGEQLMMPLYVGSEEQILAKVSTKDILFGIYVGIMLAMLLYNLFIYTTVKDRHYVYYVVYLFAVLMTQASLEGYTFRFLLPDSPYFANLLIYIFSALIGITAIEFTKNFLHTKQYVPGLHKGTYVFTIAYFITIILAIAGLYNISFQMILGLASTSAIYVLYISIRIMMKGSRSARFFFIAWSVFIVCVVVYTLKDFGVLPYNFITNSALQFGSAFEAIMLSLALADKINVFKKEKEASQEQALSIAKENERLLSEQNVLLETRVQERTLELQATNMELNKALTDLKDAETQLVESEKMASLGQLTAGIAHEINNPINFVTSNVRPLQRDVDMVVEMFQRMEEIMAADTLLEERMQKVKALKEEYDFDYLKEEIGYLLKGISEGSVRTAEIVKGLRVFSRLDEDDLKKADINEGLDSTLIIVNNLLGKITVEKKYGNLPLVDCYPGKLNQVFLNIISNAVHAINKKHDDQGGGVLTIATRRDEESVIVSIKDNGIGMDEATKKKIFEPFFTTKEVGEGTGLGMSIAYNTIKKHNATVTVESEVGVGTEFVIELPINQPNIVN